MKGRNFTKIEHEIKSEIAQAIELLGGQSDLLGVVMSWKDTIDDKDILLLMKNWNACTREELEGNK